MFRNTDIQTKVSDHFFNSLKLDARNILDLIEFLAVIICIPLSYSLSRFLIHSFDLPFYGIDFKFFLLKYLNYFNYAWHFDLIQFVLFSIMILISWFVLSHLTGMAKLPRNQRYYTVIFYYIRTNIIILVILLAFKFLFFLTSISVVFIFTYVTMSMVVTLTIRLFSIYKLRIYRGRGYDLRHIVVIADDNYAGIVDKLSNQKDWGFSIAAIATDSKNISATYNGKVDILPEKFDVKETLDNNVIDEVIYCKKENDEREIRRLVKICDEIGVIFRVQSSTSRVDPMQISLKALNNSGKLTLVDTPSLRLPLEIKTMLDIYLSSAALILLSPIMLIISVLLKLDSKGPVLFRQERIGLRGRKFGLYKFRTMVVNAEELLENLKAKNEMDGPTFKIKDDPRITRIGRFLRKTGLDELPQLINVVKGEMSLIGPRPPLESEVKQYERWYLRRLSVKPGITCTWQIMPQRNDIKFEKWMQMDLNYIDNWSLGLDAKLFFKTITTLFLAQGR